MTHREPGGIAAPHAERIDRKPSKPRDAVALGLWHEYLAAASHAARRLPVTERQELLQELESHLAASVAADRSAELTEAARVRAAIARLGNPREFLRPILADNLLDRGVSTFRPWLLLEGLYHNFFGGLKAGLVSVGFGLCYLLIAIFAAMALLKAFIPGHVGYFVYPNGARSFGIVADSTGAREMLGLWVVPLAIAAAGVTYVGLTLALRATRRSTTRG